MKEARNPNFVEALIPVIFMMVAILVCTLLWEMEPHIPIVLSCIAAAFVAKWCGYSWSTLITGMLESIGRATEALIIVMVVGMLIGSWVMCGTMPSMIYYGLSLLSPQMFLVVGVTLTFIVGMATGSSWTASGTIGVSLMGIAMGLGINPAIAAGMVISGAYMGDKWSPLSDSTNVAAATAETPLYSHVRSMTNTTIPAFILACILYAIMGVTVVPAGYDPHVVIEIQEAIKGEFNMITWWLILPTLFVIFAAVKRIPAIPSLLAAAGIGCVFSLLFQGRSMAEVLQALHYGYEADTGLYAVDRLLNRGGLDSMMWTISLIIFALAFGGILEKCGFVETLLGNVTRKIKSLGGLVAATILTSIACDIVLTDQYLAIIVPGRLFAKAYDERGLDRCFLSRVLEDGGTLWSPLVPWNGCGAYQSATLGVHNFAFLPYAFINLLTPIISVVFTIFGFGVIYKDESKNKSIWKKLLKSKA